MKPHNKQDDSYKMNRHEVQSMLTAINLVSALGTSRDEALIKDFTANGQAK